MGVRSTGQVALVTVRGGLLAATLVLAGCGSSAAPGGAAGSPTGGSGEVPGKYDLYNQCWVIKADGAYVVRDGSSFRANGDSAETAERFYMRAANLARYLFYTPDRMLLTASGGGISAVPQSAPEDGSDWTFNEAGEVLVATTLGAPLSVDADARNAADAADASLLMARERDVWLKLDELLRRLSSVSPTAVPVPSQILGLLPPDGDWPEDFALTAVAERLASNVAPPDPFNRRYTTPPGGYPAHRRAARLSYAVWAVVGGAAQPVLDARTTAERLALALRRLEALCDGLAAEGG